MGDIPTQGLSDGFVAKDAAREKRRQEFVKAATLLFSLLPVPSPTWIIQKPNSPARLLVLKSTGELAARSLGSGQWDRPSGLVRGGQSVLDKDGHVDQLPCVELCCHGPEDRERPSIVRQCSAYCLLIKRGIHWKGLRTEAWVMNLNLHTTPSLGRKAPIPVSIPHTKLMLWLLRYSKMRNSFMHLQYDCQATHAVLICLTSAPHVVEIAPPLAAEQANGF